MPGLGETFRRLKSKVETNVDPKLSSLQGRRVRDRVVSVSNLVKVKQAALRRGVWFRALSRVERGVLDLTLRYVDNVKSALLAKVLTAILEKLELATENFVDHLVRTLGVSLAQKASQVAVNWGYLSASAWAKDIGFARYLAVNSAKVSAAYASRS